MPFRILLVILFFVGGYYVIRTLLSVVAARRCANCEGRGYWLGTRGEKNTCKVCRGSGERQD